MRGVVRIRPSNALAHAALLVAILFGMSGTLAAQTGGKEERPKSGTKVSAMTGCIDEQNGHYLLVEDRTMTPVADLVADGFETEGFAKYLGHKVTVRGTSTSDGTDGNVSKNRPTFKVRSIEAVSESCGPR